MKKREKKEFLDLESRGQNEEEDSQGKVRYWKLVRLHNTARKRELQKKKKKDAKKSSDTFLKNPYEYGKKILDDDGSGDKEPTFNEQTAAEYFREEYKDLKREFIYTGPDQLNEASQPRKPCLVEPPSLEEFTEKLVSRRNKSAPGPNGVSYLVYKKCAGLRKLLHIFLCRIWLTGKIPTAWKEGVGILLPKSDDLSDPAKFRNLTLLNCSGKLFFGLWADRVLDHMTENEYIDTSSQKGFMKKTPGCVEHTQALMAELKDAKTKRRQLYVVFIDLMNAYGRVPHSLIIHALKRYHLPLQFINIILDYYDRLVVCVKTKKWLSAAFWYEVGLFQGDPLSVILFLIVFNILLEMLNKYKSIGYKPSFSSQKSSKKAFADDLTLLGKSLKEIKQLMVVVEDYLAWTVNMKAKPSKSLCMAMKVKDGKYVSFDPCLELSGARIPSIDQKPMKFLGMWIYVDLEVKELREEVKKKLERMLEKISADTITGPMKAWIYNHLVVSKMMWHFTVYNFPITFVKDLEAICNRYLKKWLGLAHPCTTTVLYRSRDMKGLQLKKLVTEFKVAQLIKGDQLMNSRDPYIKDVFSHQSTVAETRKNWSWPKELEDRKRQLFFKELVGTTATGTQGLGSGAKREQPTERKQMSGMIREFDEQSMLVSLYDKASQGRFLTWENAMSLDTGWSNLLYKLSPDLLKFHVNAIHNTVASPANLMLWKKSSTGVCALCGKYGTLSHILTHCRVALNQGRYNWRHDQTLRAIMHPVFEQVKKINAGGVIRSVARNTVFHTSGKWYGSRQCDTSGNTKSKVTFPVPNPKMKGYLSGADDWKVRYDEDEKQKNFPSVIVAHSKRPDVVIFSLKIKRVLIMELTCGNEENFSNQHQRKSEKYQELCHCVEKAGWTCKLITVEVGCRGLYNDSLLQFYNAVGISPREKKKSSERAAEIALRASYTIYLSRTNKIWSDNWELVQVPKEE